MRTLLITIVCLLLLLGGAGSVAASGFLDEMILSSEWWAGEEQQGEIEVFVLGTYGSESIGTSYHFSLRQDVGQGSIFAVNGALGLDQRMFLNGTFKFGEPNLYYGFGGLFLVAEGDKLVLLPRLNAGGKFGPERFKLVLDADFYTLLLVHGGKLELGIEFVPVTNLRLYGGLYKLFAGSLVTSELVPGTVYQLSAKYETKPFYPGGEVYFVDEHGAVVSGEAGMNFSFGSLYGRVAAPSQAAGDFGLYTIGVRLAY
ncbi:MAG: hypothetical protein GX770_06860 [Firmicutes bacterium]|nr:hypothetical protein [Bacillota bacterium]